MNIPFQEARPAAVRLRNAQGQVRRCDRIDQRHRPRDRRGARGAGRRRAAERVRRLRRDRGCAIAGRGPRCARILQCRRHVEARRDRRHDRAGGHDLGGVDILVNNAGIQTRRRSASSRSSAGTRSSPSTSRRPSARPAVLPHMEERGWGRIINIASAHGLVASRTSRPMSRQARAGRADQGGGAGTATTGVTCNAICPGWVLTPLVQKQIDDIAARRAQRSQPQRPSLLGEKQPSLEFATPEQIGALAAVPLLRRSGTDPRRCASGRWRLDGQ